MNRDLVMGIAPDSGEPVVYLDDRACTALDEMIAHTPALLEDDGVDDLSVACNYLARGELYDVVLDPEDFRARYLATVAGEPAEAAFSEGQPRLRDFGVPDFSMIQPPYLEGDDLIFFARDRFTGLAYQVFANWAEPKASRYEPLELSPVPPGG